MIDQLNTHSEDEYTLKLPHVIQGIKVRLKAGLQIPIVNHYYPSALPAKCEL